MCEYIMVKIWHGGKVIEKPNFRYDGGSSSLFQLEIDKMSYFELVGWVLDCESYESIDDFLMYYENVKSGDLVQVCDDRHVHEMLKNFGKKVHSQILDLYTVAAQPKSQAQTKSQAQPKSQSQPKSQAQPINLEAHAQSSSRFGGDIPTSSESSASGSESGSDTGEDSGDESDVDVIGVYSDGDDDEEVLASKLAIAKAKIEREVSKKSVLEKCLGGSSEEPKRNLLELADAAVENQQTSEPVQAYSSYEDSDGYVNSPGESEDDDIRGKKYKLNVPVVEEDTDWSKWVWVVGTRS